MQGNHKGQEEMVRVTRQPGQDASPPLPHAPAHTRTHWERLRKSQEREHSHSFWISIVLRCGICGALKLMCTFISYTWLLRKSRHIWRLSNNCKWRLTHTSACWFWLWGLPDVVWLSLGLFGSLLRDHGGWIALLPFFLFIPPPPPSLPALPLSINIVLISSAEAGFFAQHGPLCPLFSPPVSPILEENRDKMESMLTSQMRWTMNSEVPCWVCCCSGEEQWEKNLIKEGVSLVNLWRVLKHVLGMMQANNPEPCDGAPVLFQKPDTCLDFLFLEL